MSIGDRQMWQKPIKQDSGISKDLFINRARL